MKTPLIVALFTCTLACFADVTPNQPFIYVTGTAQLSAKADIASFRFSFIERDQDVSAAVERMKAKVTKLFEFLAAEHIAESDVTAHTERIDQQTEQKSQTVIGVRVTREFTIKVRDVTHLADLYDKLLKLGAAEINGAYFDYSKRTDLLAQCETKALEDARKHAEAIASNVGARIERVYAVSTQPLGDINDRFLPRSHAYYEESFVQPMQPPGPPKGEFVIPDVVVNQAVNVIFTLAP